MDYKKDAVLDTDNFDEEIEKHGQKYMEYVERSAEAEFDKSIAKQKTVIVRAEIAKKIRRNPKKYGLDGFPPTVVEKMLKDTVERNKEVKRADRRYFTAVKNASVLASATHAMGSYKKAAIQMHGQRVLAGFFSEPRIKLDEEDYRKLLKDKDRKSVHKRKILMRKRRGNK